MIWLGEIDRAGDYGIPVAALGLGLVLYTAKARAGARAEDMVDGAAANNRVDDTPIAEGHADSRAAPQGGRTVSIPERNPDLPLSRQAVAEGRREFLWFIAYYAIVGIVGVAIGVVGVLQQAGAVRAGHAEQPPPWSLAPGLAAVEVYVREPTRMPVGDCLIEIGRSGSVWVFWDPNKERLWRTNESVQLVDC